ncbi:MAG: peptidylprolyl isomerase [Bacteroidales bacterium]|nr:peptidylprolyl isomerase [Bacteroidales bacterium]
MATLQKIRDKAGVLVASVIGISLFAFILGDFLQKGTGFSSSPEVGSVKGNNISVQEYQQKVDEITETTKRNQGNESLDSKAVEGIYDQAWESLVLQYTMDEQYELLGIDVGVDELEDMVQGQFVDPQVQQVPIFQNPQTKIFDKSRVISFLKNLDQDPSGVARASWVDFENAIVQGKKAIKYNTLIQKAYIANKLEVADQVEATNKTVDVDYIVKKYAELKDEDVTFNDADLRSYYDSHLYEFKQDESRSITYVTFDVLPSKEDEQATRESLEQMKPEFASTNDAVQYITYNSDEPYQDMFFAKGELPMNLDTFMFSADTGAVTDVYLDGNAYKIAKLVEIKELPDSAKARHILLQVSEAMSPQQVLALSDSLQELLKNGADFAELARIYSKDGSAQKGGDLGWFKKGQMVRPFEKACFEAKKGEVVVAESQFGLHIIEVQELGPLSKQVLPGFLTVNIEPSEQTDALIYQKASEFAGANRDKEQFEKAAEELQLVPRIANNIKSSDRNIAGLENPRELIRWAFNNPVNSVSDEVLKFGEKYVVALISEVKEKGTAPFELVQTELENKVIKEKKAEKLMAEFNAAKKEDLQASADAMNLKILSAPNVTFSMYSLPSAGVEPDVIANAIYGPTNTAQGPIKGVTGVFIIKASEAKDQAKTNAEAETSKMARDFANRVNYQAIKALRENANIVDLRINYY